MSGLTKYFDGMGAFTRFLELSTVRVEPIIFMAAEAAEKKLYKKAKSLFGKSPPLAPISEDSTEQLREDGGAGGPLLIDGSLLRDSVESGHEGGLAGVGSNEPVLLYQTQGFITAPDSMIPGKIVPPRDIFLETLYESQEDIEALNEATVGALLGVATSVAVDPDYSPNALIYFELGGKEE